MSVRAQVQVKAKAFRIACNKWVANNYSGAIIVKTLEGGAQKLDFAPGESKATPMPDALAWL